VCAAFVVAELFFQFTFSTYKAENDDADRLMGEADDDWS
jgi:hypothetical protein